jgi:hypothetical protein
LEIIVAKHQDDISYYDLKGIKVKRDRCEVRGDSYLFAEMISYELRTISPDRRLPLSLIGAGVLLLILAIGSILIIAGTWIWFNQEPEYWLIFETQEIKNDVVFQTKSLDEAREIERALDLALTNYLNL